MIISCYCLVSRKCCLKKVIDFYIIFIFITNLKNIEFNKSEICTVTLCLPRKVTKKLTVTQNWYNSIEKFFQFHT